MTDEPRCMELTYPLAGKLIPCGLKLEGHGPYHCGEFGYCQKYLNGHVLMRDRHDHRVRECACGAVTIEDVEYGMASCCVEAGVERARFSPREWAEIQAGVEYHHEMAVKRQ